LQLLQTNVNDCPLSSLVQFNNGVDMLNGLPQPNDYAESRIPNSAFQHIEQTTNKALGKLNILPRKLCGTSWGLRPQTLKSTFCTVIRPVLEYATPIWTPASISVKRKLDSVQHRAAKIRLLEQCHQPIMKRPNRMWPANLPLSAFTNKLRSYDSKSAKEAMRNGETNISHDIITLLEQLHNKRKSCILQWIPAHVNIEGNGVQIYSLAKEARGIEQVHHHHTLMMPTQ
ncbi:hypothetical protein TNCV_2664271, partial [Trichonephila clavipes]